MKPHALFISPENSYENEWHVVGFESEDDAQQHVMDNDISGEHYIVPVESIVVVLRELLSKT